jgi:hypothetical protein
MNSFTKAVRGTPRRIEVLDLTMAAYWLTAFRFIDDCHVRSRGFVGRRFPLCRAWATHGLLYRSPRLTIKVSTRR